MKFIIIAVLVVILFIVLMPKGKRKEFGKKNQGKNKGGHPYEKLKALFTPAERSFYGVLNQAIGSSDLVIFGKVRVADVITPRKGGMKGAWQTAFNMISRKHFDFVLCKKGDLSVVCCIELDDSSHNTVKRKDRDTFLESACQSAALPLVRFPVKSAYGINDIFELISDYIPKDFNNKKSFDKNGTQTNNSTANTSHASEITKICPKCSSEMSLITANIGRHLENEFWGCNRYPECKHIEEKSTSKWL